MLRNFNSFIVRQLPSVQTPDRRWALFSIILSVVLSLFAIAISWWALHSTDGGGWMLIVAIFFSALAIVGIAYLIYLGFYWSRHPHRDETTDKQLKEDIRELIEEIRQDRDERNNSK
ncbi:hypothetical protein ES703_98762 [subsurface metagenome]